MNDLFDSPASPLANCFSGRSERPELLIVTGSRGAGKSTWCHSLARWARDAGTGVGGFISPAVMVGGQKVGIDLVAQLTGERRRLATRDPLENSRSPTAVWQLDSQVLAWADQMLIDQPINDLVILDELGPLEFFRGQGLQAGLRVLDDRRAPLAVVVIRPKLLSLAQERWPWGLTVQLADGELHCRHLDSLVDPRGKPR